MTVRELIELNQMIVDMEIEVRQGGSRLVDVLLIGCERGKKPYHPVKVPLDDHTCGACGFTIAVIYEYCPKCGTRILWDSPKCLTGIDE